MFKWLKTLFAWKSYRCMSPLFSEMLADPDTREQISKILDDPIKNVEGVVIHKGKTYKLTTVGAMQWLK
jgi:hypothetical protein